jgi:HK97 family phage portal protein
MKWPRIFGRRETRAQIATQRDLRLVEWLDGDASFGQRVNAVTSEWLSAVAAAIDAISGTLASLPAYVYIMTDAGRQEDAEHPIARMVRDGPNANQTWPDFAQWLVADTLRYGNGVAEKVYDDAGRLAELRPIPWPRVAPRILPTGRLVYDFSDPITLQRRRLLDTEIFHLRDRSDDGLLGRARSERAHPVIAAALALQEFSGRALANGAYPSGILSADGRLTDAQVDRLRALFSQMFVGPGKAARALILDQKIKWETVTGSPEDMELLAARRFAIEEAARLYQVPPPIIGDLTHGTFTNSETLIRFFAQSTISIWCRKIETEVHRSLFTTAERRTRQFCLDLSGLLRGDPAQRWAANEIAVRNRILTPNEIRDQEGYNPRPGGDEFPPSPTPATPAAQGG